VERLKRSALGGIEALGTGSDAALGPGRTGKQQGGQCFAPIATLAARISCRYSLVMVPMAHAVFVSYLANVLLVGLVLRGPRAH
jgi:hypothetical protein